MTRLVIVALLLLTGCQSPAQREAECIANPPQGIVENCQMTPETYWRVTHKHDAPDPKPLTPEQIARAHERLHKQTQALLNAPTRHWTVIVNDTPVYCTQMDLNGWLDTRCSP